MQENLNTNFQQVLILYVGGFAGTQQGSDSKKLQISDEPLLNQLQNLPNFCDINYTYQNKVDDWLFTPETKQKKRMMYRVINNKNLQIESTEINRDQIQEIANIIDENYQKYDSFIIIHPTDSMAYIASFISFMFKELTKTIIFTGAQVPLSVMRNDACDNLICSFMILALHDIPEVLIVFREQVMRAVRTTKVNDRGLDCFDSPNFPLLGTIGVDIKVQKQLFLIPEKPKLTLPNFRPYTLTKNIIQKNLFVIKLHPLFSSEILFSIVSQDSIHAVIIEGFGSGNLPIKDAEFQKAVKIGIKNKKLIVAVPQCKESISQDIWQTKIEALGIIYPGDITTESCVAKIYYILSLQREYEDAVGLVKQSLRGQITTQDDKKQFKSSNNIIEKIQEMELLTQNIGSRNQQNVFKHIIDQSIVPNIIMNLVFQGDLEELQSLQVDFNVCDFNQRNPFHLIASNSYKKQGLQSLRYYQIADFLLSHNVDINQRDRNRRTPLFEAIIKRDQEMIKFLFVQGAVADASDSELTSILLKSAKDGNIQLIENLFHGGIQDLNQYSNIDQRNIAHIAVVYKRTNIIKFLRTIHFDFFRQDRWGQTPISLAQEENNTEILQIFYSIQV